MTNAITIRDARPSDAPFLAKCILAGMHLYDFEETVNDDLADILENITQSEGRNDTLYTYSRTRIAEVDGKPAGSLLSYPDFRRMGFVPADHRHIFGIDFLRMLYSGGRGCQPSK